MGIYDRDYYRQESRSLFGPLGERNQVVKALILINIVLFILQLATREKGPWGNWRPGPVTSWLALDTERVQQGEVWRLITYAFLHDPTFWTHIVFNMLFLFWFGSAIEDLYGSKEFLWFYLVAAFLGGTGQWLFAWNQDQPAMVLGASAAVTATMLVFALYYPKHTILLFLVLPIPVWILVAFQVFKDVVGLLGGSRDHVAFAAHLSGALFGFLYFKYQWRVSSWFRGWGSRATWQQRSKPAQLRLYRDETTAEPVPAETTSPPPVRTAPQSTNTATLLREPDEHLEAKVDQLLDKVAKFGQESLTESERETLFRASEIYRRRRK